MGNPEKSRTRGVERPLTKAELEFLSDASTVSFIIFLDWCRLPFRPEGDEDFPRESVS